MALYHGSNNWGEAPEGTIIQVVQNVDSSNGTHGTNQWQLHQTQTITPKVSTSKIMIWGQALAGNAGNHPFALQLRVNSTTYNDYISGSANSSGGQNCLSPSAHHDGLSDNHRLQSMHYSFLHDHNSSSQLTYRVYITPRSDIGNLSWRRNEPWDNNSSGYNFHGLSILNLWEISTG